MSDNIKVVVKVRPLIPREIEEKLSYRWRVKNNTLNQLDQNGRETEVCFTFDKVYSKDTKTSDVYNDIAKPIVEAAIAGFNGTIFAYGQTSSGKTYTMSGTEESPGIIPLSVINLFEKIKTIPDRDFLVRVSFIEIYNEKVKDLLNVEKENIKIHETLQGVKVDCLERVTSSPEEVLEAMKEGEANRQTGATNMNEESSRSHSIFQITIESREHMEGEEEESGCVNVSQLNLVDLAGSERAGQTGATGLRFKEGTHINKSLSVLALVIKQLSEGPNKYANYRDSKLTRILQNSLGGNAKTSIICAITPASVEETISTLQFANRAKAIKNKPEVNAVTTNATMIQGLTKQLSKLQAELAAKRNLEVMLESKKTVEQELQKQIATLQKLILNGFGQRTGLDLGGAGRRKPFAPRRMTIHTTSHHADHEPPPSVPKFSTPVLKFNPMCLPSTEFAPVQSSSKLATVPEETRMITPPPPPRKNLGFGEEIIEIDSDDEGSETRCSPYHKCYSASVTPPCVLRRNAKEAEKNLKEIVELTEREKIYTPNVVELIEKLESNNTVIVQLQDDISSWVQRCKEKDLKIEELSTKVTKTEAEVKTITSAKDQLEVTCKEKDILLTDLEVSYETLKKQFKNREQELLNFLAEHQQHSSNQNYTSKSLKTKDKDIQNFMDMSRDISLVNSDSETSNIVASEDCASVQMQDLVTNLQSELTAKCKIIDDLENQISTQKRKIDDLESSSQKLQESVNEFINKLSSIEAENVFLQGTIETLNTIIEKQKENLESANKDIESYNSIIQELQIKLINRDEFLNSKVDNSMLESLIVTEQNIIANNDNLRNIIHIFRTALDNRNKELNSIRIGLSTENASLKEQIVIKENQITALIAEAEKLNNQLNENVSVINRLVKVENELSSQVSLLQDQNQTLQCRNAENAELIEKYNVHKSECQKDIEHLRVRNIELTRTVEEKDAYGKCLASKNTDLETRICDMAEILHNMEKDLIKEQSSSEKLAVTLEEKETEVQTLTKKIDELTEQMHLMEKTLAEKQTAYEKLTLTLSERGDNEEKMQANILELSQLRECLNQRIGDLEREMSDKDLLISAESEQVNQKNEEYLRQIAAAISKLDLLLTKLKAESQDSPKKITHISQAFNTLDNKIHSLDSLVTKTLQKTSELEEQLKLSEEKNLSQESNFLSQVESLKREMQQVYDTKPLTERINQLFYRLHNILKKLNGESEKVTEVNENLEFILDNFECKMNSLDKSVTIVLEVGEDLQLQLKTLAEAHGVQLEIFCSQIDKLSHRITQQSEDLKHLMTLCEDLEKTRADLYCKNQECIDLETKLHTAEENIKKLNDELCFKENELASLRENEQYLMTSREDLEKVRADLYCKNQECLDLETKLQTAEENIKKLNDELRFKENKLGSLQENEQNFMKSREDLEKTRADLYSKNQKCLDLETKLHTAEENNKKLSDEICLKENKIASLQENEQHMMTLREDLEKIHADLYCKKEECTDLKTKLHTAEENNRKLTDELALKVEEIASLQQNEQHLMTSREDLEKVRADLYCKNQECLDLETKLQTAEENIKKLNDELCFKENELVSLRENEQHSITSGEDLEKIRAELYCKNEECTELETKLHTAEENNRKLSDELAVKVKEITSLQENEQYLMTLREDLEKILADLYCKKEECTELDTKLHTAEENNRKLSDELALKVEEIASLQQNEQHLMASREDLEKVSADLYCKNQECLDLETKLQIAEENIKKLNDELCFKENELVSLRENEQHSMTSAEDLEKIRAELYCQKEECTELETKLHTAEENNRKVSDELALKVKDFASLQQNDLISGEDLENTRADLFCKIQEFIELETKLHATEENNRKLTDELCSKENEIASLRKNAISLRPHRESIKSVLSEANLSLIKQENESELKVSNELNNLFNIISKLCYECEIEFSNNTASSIETAYQELAVALDKVYIHINVSKTENDVEKSSMKKLLREAEIEVDHLTDKHSKLAQRNQQLLQEIDEVNNELLGTRELLRDLNVELQSKRNEIKVMEEKAIMWKEQFVRYEDTVNKELTGLVASNKKLKSLLASQNVQSVTLNKSDNSEENFKMYEPQSLVSICCKNIIDFIQPNVSENNSSTTISSKCSIQLNSCQSQTDHIQCECDRLTLKLNKAQEENLQLVNDLSLISHQSMYLTDMLKELEVTNQCLLEEREALRKEIQMLVEPAIELQKKIANHKTYLSTLTATTHAENTLLKSKLRVLNHNHKRYVHVCQRELPVVKSQLKELMSLLKECSCNDKQNTSFKRYSLPDVLDNNTSVSTLKHESTLDGDLLMLDTNVTLTTINNTLVGPDQTCLEITQNFDAEASCQSNDISKDIDPYLAYSQLQTLTTDNQNLVEKIDSLINENLKLKEHINFISKDQNKFKDAQTSPLKIETKNESISANIEDENICEFCNESSKELHLLKEELNAKIHSLSNDLKEMQEEKDRIEIKFKNLSLEIPSTEALVKKLNNAEKECNSRLIEINKITSELTKKNKMVKELQEENDTLSMQVMENISEGDELKKELDNLKDEHQKLIEICKNKKSDYISEDCLHCQMKDDLIKMLQQQHLEQPKLNRSLSDSESSSRHNKICTLQNELHASKEDCKKITEEVATIKNHLERSNISMSQAMDLDDSMGEAGIFTITKDLNGAEKTLRTNDCNIDDYAKEKRECFKFYVEKICPGKENIEADIKIIDIMKMLYNNLIARHGNEVENLMNKLRDFEDTKKDLHLQLDEANSKNMEVTKELKDSTVQNVLKQIQENINILNSEMGNIVDPDKNTVIVTYFKENLLRVLDTGFGLTFVNIFEIIINSIFDKHGEDLSIITEQYTKLQNHMENVVTELNTVNENLKQVKDQLSVKESEYNLLKTQKEMILEISNAVTLDIVKREKELNETLNIGCKKLLEHGLIADYEFDNAALSLSEKFQLLFELVLKSKQNDTATCKTREELTAELEMLKSSLHEKEQAMILMQEKKESALEQIEKEKQTMALEINTIRKILEEKDNCVEMLLKQVSEVDRKLQEQKLSHEDIVILYESKLQDNVAHIEKLTEEIDALQTKLNGKEELYKEIEMLKEVILQKENVIERLENDAQKYKDQLPVSEECSDILAKVEILKEEYDNLVSLNKVLIKEKEIYALELENAKQIIDKNTAELETMTSDILVLRESVKENVNIIQSLTAEAKSMTEQNIQLKKQFEQKNEDCSRLEMNIKTHEKTAQIQSKMIIRLQKQKEEDDKILSEKEKCIDDLVEKYSILEKECEEMKQNLEGARKDVEILRNQKEYLEGKLTELETEWQDGARRRPSMEAGADSARRRRQSLHDSKRFDDIENVFEARSSPDDFFGNATTSSTSANGLSSPTRRSARDTSHGDEDSGRCSVTQTRRRRQSLHDQRRGAAVAVGAAGESPAEVAEVRARLAATQRELAELRDQYRELDEECDTCAQYLRERDDQCRQLRKDNTALEMRLADLTTKLAATGAGGEHPSVAHAAVNTDEDWANLHSVVVDRMSFDAEVEKNKKLSRTIDELRCNKQELKATIAKMQRALEKGGSEAAAREVESVRAELSECRQQLHELQQRYRELDEECDTCAQYLRERDDQCRKLRQAKNALEAKLQELTGEQSACTSTRRKRQSLHDSNRSPAPSSGPPQTADAQTQASEDLLNCQVDREDNASALRENQVHAEIKRLKMKLESCLREKVQLEKQLMTAVPPLNPTLYVATGSAIVQNQQITDVMRENQKLKKINAKLLTYCKNRPKKLDQENEAPSDLG